MAFTVEDLPTLIRLLNEYPEWKQALRSILLTEELLTLPERFERLVERVDHLTAVVERLVLAVEQLQAGQEELRAGQAELRAGLEELRAGQEELRAGQAELRAGQEELRAAQAELKANQERMERRFSQEIADLRAQVTQEISDLRSYVGKIANAYGLTLEGEAEDAIEYLAQQKGWEFLVPPQSLSFNGEIDYIAIAKDSEGTTFTLLVEVKARLTRRSVREWASRVRSETFRQELQQRGYPPPYRMYLMGFRIDPPVAEEAQQQKVGLFTGRGERVPSPLLT